MVMAHTFRGPNAARQAQQLAMELRTKNGLAAYVWYVKIHPGGTSNIFSIPPTAPSPVKTPRMSSPEKLRTYDEAAVLVGDCKTMLEAKQLWKTVKHLHPACIDGKPGVFLRNKGGLSHALITTNPLVAAQRLYPGRPIPVGGGGQPIDPNLMMTNFEMLKKPDPLVKKMNQGPHSIFKCQGPYTMPVATFTASPLNNATMAGLSSAKPRQGM